MINILKKTWFIQIITAQFLLIGCNGNLPIKVDGNGKIRLDAETIVDSIDKPLLFGDEIGGFKLPGQQIGSLRKFQGKYSVKVGNFKVVELPGVTSARISQSSKIGDRTLLVLETSAPYCDYKTTIMSIKDNDVLKWDFGACNVRPQITNSADKLTIDYVQPNSTDRFVYTEDMRLKRATIFNGASPKVASSGWGSPPSGNGWGGASSDRKPSANIENSTETPGASSNPAPEKTPAPSVRTSKSTTGKTKQDSLPQKQSPTVARSKPRPEPLPPEKELVFREEQPTRIKLILDEPKEKKA